MRFKVIVSGTRVNSRRAVQEPVHDTTIVETRGRVPKKAVIANALAQVQNRHPNWRNLEAVVMEA